MKTKVLAFIPCDCMDFIHMIPFKGGSAAQSWDLLHFQMLGTANAPLYNIYVK